MSCPRKSLLAPLVAMLVGCPAPQSTALPGDNPASGPQQPGGTVKDPALGAGLSYPNATRVDHVDDYHGTKVADPYRWLEDPDSPKTREWIEKENELTFAYLDKIGARKALQQRLTELWNYERWGVPEKKGKRYVVSRNDGLQNQSVIYTLGKLGDEPKLLLDPNKLSSDGTSALGAKAFSNDGKLMTYGVSDAGSDWQVFRVRNVETGKDLGDELRWIKFSGASWTKDGKGFYYSAYDPPKKGEELEELNFNQKVFYHRLGQEQSKDELVYARPDHKEWGFDADVTDDGRYLVITVRIGTDPKTSVFFQDLRSKGKARKTVELLPGFEARYAFVGNQGPVFWFRTDNGASRYKVISVDTRDPAKRRDVIPEAKETLRGVDVIGNRFVAQYLDNAHAKVSVFTLKGKRERDVELPGIGSVSGFRGKPKDKETFYSFTGWAQPNAVYRYDMKTGKSSVFREPKLAFNPDDFETKQVFYESKDGTKIPMFITHKKGLKIDGKRPTYLYGYGGFNIPLTPRFSVPDLVWMELGGVYAVPNLRGGGEFGEAWHQAGTKLVKQNVFDDFIAAAQWLTKNGYTNPSKLAIGGRSNGGLLVGAVMTQRPELFAAALPGVGVMDMLRFNKFTIGWAWQSDYGSPQDPAEFKALYAYSPYHNLRDGTAYPATLVYTADHDDRVVPAHSFKFAAALQHHHKGENPVLIRIDTKSGHGAGKPTSKKIEEWADLWGFLVENLDVDVSALGGAG